MPYIHGARSLPSCARRALGQRGARRAVRRDGRRARHRVSQQHGAGAPRAARGAGARPDRARRAGCAAASSRCRRTPSIRSSRSRTRASTARSTPTTAARSGNRCRCSAAISRSTICAVAGEERFERLDVPGFPPLEALLMGITWEFPDGRAADYTFAIALSLEPYNERQAAFRRILIGWFSGVTLTMLVVIERLADVRAAAAATARAASARGRGRRAREAHGPLSVARSSALPTT